MAQEFNPARKRPWKIWRDTLVRLRGIIRASFSQERMTYIPQESKVVYQSKDGKKEKVFDAFEWLANLCSHVPNKGEQMVRYYGFYSNVSRGKRKKQDHDDLIPSILEPVEDPDFSGDGSSKEFRKNWARLFQKIYEVDPLTCAKCGGTMAIISFIEDPEIIKKILKSALGGWDLKARPPPKAKRPSPDIHIDYVYFVEDVYFYKSRIDSQLPPSDDYLYGDVQYPGALSS